MSYNYIYFVQGKDEEPKRRRRFFLWLGCGAFVLIGALLLIFLAIFLPRPCPTQTISLNSCNLYNLSVASGNYRFTKIPTSSTVYAHSQTTLVLSNLQTQSYSVVGDMGVELFDIGVVNRTVYGIGINGVALVTLNLTSGQAYNSRPVTGFGSAGSNSLCGGPDGNLYGVYSTTLVRTDPITAVATAVRTGIPATLGDCVFYDGYFWWTGYIGSNNSLYKLKYDATFSTNPVIRVGDCDVASFGLANWNNTLYQFVDMNVSSTNVTTALTSLLFTMSPSFGYGFVQGAASLTEDVSACDLTIQTFNPACFPSRYDFTGDTIVYFEDVRFPYRSARVSAGGYFVLGVGFVVTSSSGVVWT
jgi:hypothetical protein